MYLFKITLDGYYDGYNGYDDYVDCASNPHDPHNPHNWRYSMAYAVAPDPATACEIARQQMKKQKPNISGDIIVRCMELLARTEQYGKIPRVLHLTKGRHRRESICST